MAEQTAIAGVSPLRAAGAVASSTVADVDGLRGVTLQEMPLRAALLVIARRGAVDQARRAATGEFALDLPRRPAVVSSGGVSAQWSGPGKWLLIADLGPETDLRQRAARAFEGCAALVCQTDARLELRISGPRARDALAKLIGIDLAEEAFPVGCAAMTGMAHIPVELSREADEGGHPVFALSAPRSYAGSVWHHLVTAAAEYGLEAGMAAAAP